MGVAIMTAQTFRKTKILLDYDDTLGKTESVALSAACDLTNEVLRNIGSAQELDQASFIERFPGRTYSHILREICEEYKFELSEERVAQLIVEEEERVLKALSTRLEPADDSLPALEQLNKDRFEVAVVSSSSLRRLFICLDRTGQDKFIARDHVFSARSSLPVPSSKPDPAIWLHALEKLQIEAADALGVEDSGTGVLSLARADIPAVGSVGVLPKAKQKSRAELLFTTGARWVIDSLKSLPILARTYDSGDIDAVNREFGKKAWGF